MSKQIGATRAYRIAPPRVQTGDNPADYIDEFEVSILDGDARTAEQWARAIFEEAPLPVRWFLLFGWRWVLGLRLGPRLSSTHVLGWQIVKREPDAISLELRSALMVAQLSMHLVGSKLIWNTYVYYTRGLARPLWTAVGLLHRCTVPALLGYTASSFKK
ncbi:DUF2867 domain-containing protein [Ktedonosporobacter rubrisoli]|uniref:DUF2867 domain-containing protein n=1 Tax=Ktedonosporobacter rubrisoli TaxID=2509675 RepID=A0A4P6JRZ3_KTERU|nr:DUF2867 domain-containing protein [Ktedonosporobacter rubrisoli]QBD78144.1 DUF2867 domain-containing protein [Ktedonosporobacter rubrisoli]